MAAVFTQCRKEWNWLAENPVSFIKKPAHAVARDRRILADEMTKILIELNYEVGRPIVRKKQLVGAFFCWQLKRVCDELAGWFASMDRYSASKGGDRALWLEAYGGRPYTLDRVKNGGEPFYIPTLAISVLGGIQPDRLQSCLLKGDDDGLSARFLYIYPNPAPRQRPKYLADDRIIKQITSKLEALAPDMDENQKPCSRNLPLSPEAANIFEDWWQQLLAVAPEAGRMSGWWGKAQGLCLRIALVLENLDWVVTADGLEPTEVSVRTMENAIHFMENYAGPMAERAHGMACATVKEVNMRRLERFSFT